MSFTFLQEDLLQWQLWKDCLPYHCMRETAGLGGNASAAETSVQEKYICEDEWLKQCNGRDLLQCQHWNAADTVLEACKWFQKQWMTKASWCCSVTQKTKFVVFADSSPQTQTTALSRRMPLSWQDPQILWDLNHRKPICTAQVKDDKKASDVLAQLKRCVL